MAILGTPKAVFVELLQSALSRYLVIDKRHVETKLLSQDDGSVTFSDVKIVSQRIELSRSFKEDGLRKVLALEGQISNLTVGWKWSSFMILEESWINIEGVNLMGSVVVELQGKDSDSRHRHRDPPKDFQDPVTKSGLLNSISREFHQFLDSVKDIIPSSQMLQRISYHFLNTLSIIISKLDLSLRVSDDAITNSMLGWTPFQLMLGFDLLEFLPLAPGSQNGGRRTSTVETNRFVHIGVDAFYMDVVEMEENEEEEADKMSTKNWQRLPVLQQPLTYAATLRRVHGRRFFDNMFGFEIVGRPTKTEKASIHYDYNHGVTVNAGRRHLKALTKFRDILFGQSEFQEEVESQNVQEVADKKGIVLQVDEGGQHIFTTTMTQILCTFLYLVIILAACAALQQLSVVCDEFRSLYVDIMKADPQTSHVGLFMLLYRCAAVTVCIALIVYSRKILSALKLPAGKAWLHALDKETLQKSPAVFRLPMSYLAINIPGDIMIEFFEVSMLGRINFQLVNISAEKFKVSSPLAVSELQAQGNGMRLVMNQDGILMNLDTIHELNMPGRVALKEPLLGTVVQLKDGFLRVKINTFVGTKMKSQQAHASEKASTIFGKTKTKSKKTKKNLFVSNSSKKLHRPFQNLRKASSKESSTVQKQAYSSHKENNSWGRLQIRKRMYNDIEIELSVLRDLATAFEKIRVRTHVRNLRLYKNSFRGSDAVDFLMEMAVIKSRKGAIEVARQFQADFNLFEDVTSDFLTFQDDEERLYHFIPENKRRGWAKNFGAVRQRVSEHFYDTIASPTDERLFPFLLTMSVKEIVFSDDKNQSFITMQSGFLYLRPSPFVSAMDVMVSFDSIGNDVFLVGNGRMHGFFHPDLPREILNLQISVDFLKASKGYSVESWMESLGYKEGENHQEDQEISFDEGGWKLPYVHVSPFSLNLALKGFIALNDGSEKFIRVDDFSGTDKTTSNNLIMYFITVVLARTPGLLQDVKILGMDVADLAGVGTGMTVGAQLIPGGQYIALAVLATVDMVTGAIAAGKESRGRPDDKYRFGDMVRGTVYFVKEVNRKGALRRGKSYRDFYDDNDEVKVDPADFIVGATEETGQYLDRNKARFVGATVGCIATVTACVVFTPLIGLGVGMLIGQGAQQLMIAAEKTIKKNAEENCREMDYRATGQTCEQSELARPIVDHKLRTGQGLLVRMRGGQRQPRPK